VPPFRGPDYEAEDADDLVPEEAGFSSPGFTSPDFTSPGPIDDADDADDDR
jgi:hypothetical protein